MKKNMELPNTLSTTITAKKYEQIQGRRHDLFKNAHVNRDYVNEPTAYRVDLVTYEHSLHGKVAFTRKRFEDMIQLREKASTNPDRALFYPNIRGKAVKIWNPRWPFTSEPGAVFGFRYMNYVQMSPLWNPKGEGAKEVDDGQLGTLHWYNEHEGWAAPSIEMPIFFVYGCWDKQSQDGHRKYWQDTIARFSQLWQASQSAKGLREKFLKAATSSVRITKIVCFGFGAMAVAKKGKLEGKYEANGLFDPLQYLSAITIANTLNEAYQEDDDETPPVRIILQDPMYTDIDLDTWPQYYSDIEVVEDPAGFLHLDEHTLVMTNGLHLSVPLMQICADLLPEGPAGFIIDKPDLDPRKRLYSMQCRVSQKVARLLRDNYDRSDFDDHTVEQELWDECCQNHGYWLWKVDCFLKPKMDEMGGLLALAKMRIGNNSDISLPGA